MQVFALWLLRLYKRWISPAFPPSCRYRPTCSEYAMEAIECYGVARGALMAIWRLLRCHPLAKGGYDPAVKNNFRPGGMTDPVSVQVRAARLASGERRTTSNSLGGIS